MSKYQNPIPSLDDKYVSTDFAMAFHFDEPMTEKEAAENLEHYVKTHGVPEGWVHMGKNKELVSPDKLNMLKDRIGRERIHGEWLCLGESQNDWIHCQCSICGHTEEAIRAVKTGSSSGDYIEAIYKFCCKCGSIMTAGIEARRAEADTEETPKAREKLSIETPRGRIEADIIPDDEYPAIAVTIIDVEGKEVSSAIMEWHAVDEQYKLRVYSHENPDGDPIHIIPMSRVYYDTEEDD